MRVVSLNSTLRQIIQDAYLEFCSVRELWLSAERIQSWRLFDNELEWIEDKNYTFLAQQEATVFCVVNHQNQSPL